MGVDRLSPRSRVRRQPSPREGNDFFRCFLLGVDEDHIGFGVRASSLQRLFEPEISDQRFGARDRQQIALAACSAGRRNLALEFLDPDKVLSAAGEQTCIFGESLVLDDHRSHPSASVRANDVHDIDGVAIAGVEIGYNRHRDSLGDRTRHVEMLGERQQARIGHPIGGGQLETTRPHPVDAGELGEASR